MKHIKTTLKLFAILTLLVGIIYPLAVDLCFLTRTSVIKTEKS